MFLGLPDPDQLDRGTDYGSEDPYPDPYQYISDPQQYFLHFYFPCHECKSWKSTTYAFVIIFSLVLYPGWFRWNRTGFANSSAKMVLKKK